MGQGRYPGAEFESNSGVYIGGDNSGTAAAGHARVTQVTYGSQTGDPLEMIDRLLRKLEADANALGGERAEDVADEVQQLHTDLHRHKRNPEGIRSTLSRLTAAATSAAPLLATVNQITDLIAKLAH